MSQIKFTSEMKGRPVLVVTGYDRPLDYCHLTVYDVVNERGMDDSDGVLYSELNNPNPFKMQPEGVIEKLDKLGIPYPSDLSDQLVFHQVNKVGNLVIRLFVNPEDDDWELPE